MDIGFVNFNQESLSRANKIMKMLQGQGAIDELGFGRIRDAFSNYLLPGLSVIHTKAKYLTLLPALLKHLEKSDLNTAETAREKIRELEIKTTWRLMEGSPGENGIIGEETLRNDKRYVKFDPMDIYGGALERYGLIKTSGNIGRLLVERSAICRNNPKRDREIDADETEGNGVVFLTCGEDYEFKTQKPLQIRLTRKEAAFLQRQITRSTEGSLLNFMLDAGLSIELQDKDRDLTELAAMIKGKAPDELYSAIRLARRFSRFADLIRTRYAMIFDIGVNASEALEKATEHFNYLLEEFSYEFTPEAIHEVVAFATGNNVKESTCIRFSLECARLITERDFETLDIRIKNREIETKGLRRAKLSNLSEYETGKGFQPSAPMTFRWSTIGFNIIKEIREGLNNE